MPRLLLILTLLGSQCVFGQSLHFGTNRIAPGETLRFTTRVGAKGQAELSRIGMLTATAQGALVLPANCTNLIKPCPLLVVSVPSGGSAISAMPSVTNIALSQGWAVLAADGPRIAADQDTIQFGWAILSSVLDHVARTWPPAKQWPVACAGFSGGAKRSAAVAGAMMKDGWRVIGVFMGGCNEDRASLALQLFQPPPTFKRVPMFLSNGEQDPIADPSQGAAVRESMLRSGFTTIRLESYSGRHQLNKDHLRESLEWFTTSAGVRSR